MRHYSRSHGSHCYLRSFKTSCPRCGIDVLYWECTHGSKVFFNYPPYGKLQRHFCRVGTDKNSNEKDEVIVKTPIGLLINPFISCPICGKLFKEENALKNHFKSLRKQDDEHKLFFSNKILIDNSRKKDEFTLFEENKFQKYPKFGKINLKKKEKD